MVLHVGLPKTGTTYLQAVLAHHRDALREAGVLYPFVRPQAMFLGAVEVRGSREKFGLTAEDVAGTWQALCDRVLSHAGTSVISHEVLGGAEPDEIAAALAPLAGIEVDVVVTARDLGRQATAHWQEEVKLGDTRSFAELEHDQLRADVPEGERPHFWHAQDYAAALRRWATAVPAERVHLVVGPPPGAAPEVLWQRFAEACGIGQEAEAVVDADAVAPANRSLTTEAIALLREVNRELDGRLTPREHARLRQAGAGGGPAGRPTGYAAADARLPGRRPDAGGRRLAERDRGERAPRARLARRPDARAGGSRRPAPRRRTSRRPGPGRGRRRGPRSPPASRSPARRLGP